LLLNQNNEAVAMYHVNEHVWAYVQHGESIYPSEAEDLNLYISFCVCGFLCKLNKFCADSQEV